MVERIVAAAVIYHGLIIYAPPPARHGDILRLLHEVKEGAGSGVKHDGQGFITSTGRYVARIEAMQIAKAAGQLIRKPYNAELFSENLFGDGDGLQNNDPPDHDAGVRKRILDDLVMTCIVIFIFYGLYFGLRKVLPL